MVISRDMVVVFTGEQDFPETVRESILVMGPGPDRNGYSWKVHEALPALERAGFKGVVFIMEPRPDDNGVTPRIPLVGGYASIAGEEHHKAQLADVHMAWLPDADEQPSLNTRFQIGKSLDSGKLVIGSPGGAKAQYILHDAQKRQVPTASTIDEMVERALDLLGDGALRTGGERYVPPYVWNTAHFQQWYGNLRAAGHELHYAEVVWSWRIGPRRQITFFWILYPKVWIPSENRYKDNEVVLARPDISATVLYRLAERLDDCEVVIVKEVRVAASNPEGMVSENAGGSSWNGDDDPLQCASEEVHEETDLVIDPARFTYYGVRQIAPTISSHLVHLFGAQVTLEELDKVEADFGVAHGVAADTERSYALRVRVGDIRRGNLVGWGDWGMILHVLLHALGL